MAACPGCGSENPAEARFCMGCAAPLGGAEPPREERRVVSVLFADLVGFTARAETLDPEDVRAFLVPYYDVLTTEVAAHGGRVDRFLGDGVMALFGAPTAHEDDAERAVRAALRVAERVPTLGLGLHVRLGINTGPVLFAAGGGDRDDAVTGDAVNTAARLQAAAPLDGVVVGEATYHATTATIRYEALPPITAKGKAAPVALWRALGPAERTPATLPVEATPFVGREAELALLIALFERARNTPSLELVTVIGDPGLGKSRLVRELVRHVERLPDGVTWRAGRCLPYGDGLGLWALGEIVEAQAGIVDGDDQTALAAKLEATLDEPDPSTRAWLRDRLAPLVGLDVRTTPPQQEEAFTAWRRFIEGIARRGPTVLVVEDLHWAGDAMLAFLEHLADHAAGLPLLVVATARPELEERYPRWLAPGTRGTVLSLGTLGEPDMRTLVTSALPGAGEALLATVLARAAGSPLYAEQLAAMLRDDPAAGADTVPASLGALLAARIDTLSADAKAVLLDASVIGRTFWTGALGALAHREREALEAALAELTCRYFVRPVLPSSKADETEYAFVHALVRDVAYAELPRASRLTCHRAAATWITERHAGSGLGPDAEPVSAHLERSLELARAVGTADVAAIEADLETALLGAADHAMWTQPTAAVDHVRHALDLLAPDDPHRPGVLARLGRALMATTDYPAAASALGEAAELLRAQGGAVEAAALAAPLAIALHNGGKVDEGTATLAAARATLQGAPSPELLSVVAAQAMSAMGLEHDDIAASLADEALRLSEVLGLPPPHRALAARGGARFRMEPVAGEADLRLAFEQAVADGDLRSALVDAMDLAWAYADYVGPSAGLPAIDDAIAFAEQHGFPSHEAASVRMQMLLAAGRWDELVADAEAPRSSASERGDAFSLVTIDKVLLAVRVERGEPTGSLADFIARARDVGWPRTEIAWIVAEAALADGDAESARRALGDALAATRPDEVKGIAAFVRACLHAGSSELARRALVVGGAGIAVDTSGAAEASLLEAEDRLGEAQSAFRRAAADLGNRGFVPERAHALAGLGRCLLGLGEVDEGAARLGEARAIWVGLRATPRVAEIDALLSSAIAGA